MNLGDSIKKKMLSIKDIAAGITIHNNIIFHFPEFKLVNEKQATRHVINYIEKYFLINNLKYFNTSPIV